MRSHFVNRVDVDVRGTQLQGARNQLCYVGMVALLVPATLFELSIGPAVVLHEGSTIVVVPNALRLLAFTKRES